MKKTEETVNTKFGCEFCKREFIRESTVLKHICEYKHRWLEKDKQSNRLGFQAWLEFYKKNSTSKKYKTYEEFIRNPYYTAFAKFGLYCTEVNVINVSRYLDWLLKDQIKIDEWCHDSVYTRFLIEYLRSEDPFDAIHRSVETTMKFAELERIQHKDYLRYGNKNKICYAVTKGKISPWMLYQSESGVHFLDTINPDHVKLIIDYISPEQWTLRFRRDPKVVGDIKDLLNAIGL